MRNCYTYLIGWTNQNIWYYGKRTRVNCKPSDLWVKYFTSSVHVAAFREAYGEPDVIEVRNLFGLAHKECNRWEHRVLKRINAKSNPHFLNKNNGCFDFDTTGMGFGRKGVKQDWFVAYDVNGAYIGKKLKSDPLKGVLYFGSGLGKKRPQDWANAYGLDGKYICRVPMDDPNWGILYFGVRKNKPNKSKGLPQDWASAYSIDGVYIGKVLRDDLGWGTLYFGQNTGGTRSDAGKKRNMANAYDIKGVYIAYVDVDDPNWGILYFGNRHGKINPTKGTVSEYFNAYDISGIFVGKKLKNDPERGKTIFGCNTKHK